MGAFIQLLKTPNFWYATVAMNLVLHVAASYLRQLLDKGLSTGGSFLRGLSKKSREKRAARAQQISAWIEARDDGAILALSEGNFLSLAGLLLLSIALIGCVAALATQFDKTPILTQLPLVLLLLGLGLAGRALLSIGGQIRTAVRQHPRGLAGLYPNR
jgi:hypothetical protein